VDSMDLQSLQSGLGLLRGALDSIKALNDLLPKSSKRNEVELKLQEAERQVALSESQIAQSLGYKLCKCTFPPQIMLSGGVLHEQENFVCPKCNKYSVRGPRPTTAIADFDVFDP
jgi:hypothetical protein